MFCTFILFNDDSQLYAVISWLPLTYCVTEKNLKYSYIVGLSACWVIPCILKVDRAFIDYILSD